MASKDDQDMSSPPPSTDSSKSGKGGIPSEKGKRQRLSPSKEPESPTRDDIDKIIQDSNEQMLKTLMATVQQCKSQTDETIKKIQEVNVQRFNLAENRITELEKSMAILQEQNSELVEHVKELREAKEAVRAIEKNPSTPRKAPPTDSQWDRAPRADVLTIGAGENVAKKKILEAITPWLTKDAGYDPSLWRLDGPQFARKFDLVFNGANSGDTGARRANYANLLLRNEDRTWNKIFVKNPEGEDIELFISKDDSPKHNREITLGKRLEKAIKRAAGADREELFFFHKPSRSIKFKGKLLAKVEAESFEICEVMWLPKTLDEAKLADKKDVIKEDFHSHTGVAPGASWVV